MPLLQLSKQFLVCANGMCTACRNPPAYPVSCAVLCLHTWEMLHKVLHYRATPTRCQTAEDCRIMHLWVHVVHARFTQSCVFHAVCV